jgi:hypothetical protein
MLADSKNQPWKEALATAILTQEVRKLYQLEEGRCDSTEEDILKLPKYRDDPNSYYLKFPELMTPVYEPNPRPKTEEVFFKSPQDANGRMIENLEKDENTN